MSIFIGRKFNIGIGKESSRGTAVAASFWLPRMDGVIDDRIDTVIHDSSLGIIEDAETSDITKKFAEGTLTGRVNDLSFGLILAATLGTEAAPSLVETGVYDHVFTVAESAQHPSLTIAVNEPNATSARYPLAMIDSLELNIETGKYATYTIGFTANTPTSTSNTPSYSTETVFLPQQCVAKIATDLSGLGAASAINTRKLTLSVAKNIEDDPTIGNVSPVDRYNKQFAIEGTLELVYDARTYIDTIMLGDLAKALRIQCTNTTLIGAASYPTLTIDLAKVKLMEVSKAVGNNDIVLQTIKFKAFYSIAEAEMITATLRNTRSSAY